MACKDDKVLTLNDAEIKSLSFEDGFRILEGLVSQVEQGEISLEKTLIYYEQGTKLTAHLRKILGAAEEKITILRKGEGGFSEP